MFTGSPDAGRRKGPPPFEEDNNAHNITQALASAWKRSHECQGSSRSAACEGTGPVIIQLHRMNCGRTRELLQQHT